MTTYTAIPDADLAPEKVITTATAVLLRDNPIAITEGATGAPRIQPAALANMTSGNYVIASGSGTSETTSYVKFTEHYFPQPGTFKSVIDLVSDEAAVDVYARIYKNGVAHGTERSTGSTTGATWTEDITVAAGDLIQLYLKGSGVAPMSHATGSIKIAVANPFFPAPHYDYA
jgi:hypothetical protein